VESFGTLSLDWLGVPLRSDSGVFGALVIQRYRGGRRYTVCERDLLIFVSAQVALSIERARAQAEQRITTAAMDLAIDPVLGADATGKLVFVNQAACASLGYSREELLLLTMWDVDPQIDPKLWQDHWLSIRHAGSLREESRHRRKDGSFFPVELSHSFLAYEGREVIYTNVRDISSRKAADAALRASEEKFSRAFHTSPDAIVITRLDTGTYMDVSQGFEALTGWSREEVLGHPALELNIWADPLDRGRAMELVRTHGEYTGMEFQFCRKDGSLVPGLMSGKIMDVDGIPCVLSITRDLSDRKRAEEALRQSQKLESLGILAGGIAHDFNNLLTVVMGNLNLAQMHLPENATAQTYLANTEAAVLRATELTKQMLAYSGRGHFLVKPHDLNEVVREVAHLLAVSIPKKVRLRFDLGPGIPAIHADAAQLQQVVMNLITNASDAIGDREGTIHLATSAAFLEERELQSAYHTGSLPSGLYTILEVTDTGVGMSREVMARIFDPFFTTKAAGRGLGLSAMLGILRGHGAGLSIVSEVGRGSTFRICFPASKESPITPAPAVQEASTQPLKGRVLLVDDEDLILQTIGSALQSLGLEVITASDGLEALEQFNRARPELDLVLMDLTMPRMDGREAFQAMHDLDPSIPVLLSSGFTEQDSLHLLSGVDPAGFIQKPYQIKELRLLLHRVLGN
jgi:PAS domain S-box-containing protein